MNKWKKIALEQAEQIAYAELRADEDNRKIKDLTQENEKLKKMVNDIQNIVNPPIPHWYSGTGVSTTTDKSWVTINKGYL